MHNAPHYDVDLKLVFHSIRMESLHTVYRCCSYDPNRDDLFHTEHTLTPLLPLAQKARRRKATWPQASRLSQSKLADHPQMTTNTHHMIGVAEVLTVEESAADVYPDDSPLAIEKRRPA
jgi:hypothetical protein